MPRHAIAMLGALILAALSPCARAEPVVLDAFDTTSAWTADAPEGVEVSIHDDPNGADGHALRIDYDFVTGGGYCVVRRTLDLPLPANYRFDVDVKGDGRPNNLEFKIIGPPSDKGTDVWWVNRRAYDPPREWTHLINKRRSFEYAWGPSGGEPLPRVVVIEIAIAMAEGGKGSLWLDNLTFEELPAPTPYTATPTVTPTDAGIDIAFNQSREFGGVTLRWAKGHDPVVYDLESTENGAEWRTVARVRGSVGGTDRFFLPDSSASALRVRWLDPNEHATLESFDVLPLAIGDDINAFVSRAASESPRGWFPKPFTGKQCFWTIVGGPEESSEALISEFGAIEPFKGGPTLEPFLVLGDRVITWADAEVRCALVDGYIPIPTVTWVANGLTLEITALHHDVPPERSEATSAGLVRYRVTNTSDQDRAGDLVVGLRPFQVLPPWQRLNLAGGVSPIERIRFQKNQMVINTGIGIADALTEPDLRFAADSTEGDVVARLACGLLPRTSTISDAQGLGSGAYLWEFDLAPGASKDVIVRIPTRKVSGGMHALPRFSTNWSAYFDFALQSDASMWRGLLNRAEFAGPPEAMRAWDTVRSNLGYILINADGPAIQPGSRTYERSWIRDGSLTGTSLLNFGHADRVVDFLKWYSEHLYDNGKVPCVVDKRGPDPYPEHDSHGEYVYLLDRTVRYTNNLDLARELYPKALHAIDYMESLRAERLTPEYADPNNPLHRFYGILPESGSHEGYMNKPMHSFWDDFFALEGLKDIVRLAGMVGDTASVPRLTALRDDFRRCFGAAIRGAIADNHIDYIPGCVELGDFDATSTAIGIYPCSELDWLPEPQTRRTFDKYWTTIEGRRSDSMTWHDYTPYETRIIAAFVLMGETARAHALMEWLFLDQLPHGWNHWAEVAYREDDFPGWIGDMPHTWVGSGYINSVRTMLVHERESDDALVLAAGVPPAWLDDPAGISVTNWPTEFGSISYTLTRSGNTLTLEATGAPRTPAGGIAIWLPEFPRITGATAAKGEITRVSDHEVFIRSAPCRVEIKLAK